MSGLHFQWVPCYHCEKPACVESLPRCLSKEAEVRGSAGRREASAPVAVCAMTPAPTAPLSFENEKLDAKVMKCDICL